METESTRPVYSPRLLLTSETLLHSVVPDNAECLTVDIDDFFLLSTLPRAENIRILVPIIPDDIREEF